VAVAVAVGMLVFVNAVANGLVLGCVGDDVVVVLLLKLLNVAKVVKVVKSSKSSKLLLKWGVFISLA